MTDEPSPTSSRLVSRRGLLTGVAGVAGVAFASPGLAACGSSAKNDGPGTSSADALKQALPRYLPSKAVVADIPGSPGANGTASDPAFLTYPANPVRTVNGIPGSGGTYTTRTPLWGAIPPSNGNAYYAGVNKALGATLRIQPSDGNNYVDSIPALFASGNLPDWIQIPSYANSKLNLGSAVSRLADLTPYLSGDAISEYPNLANIPTVAWQSGVWDGKLFGLPCYASAGGFPGYIFYRKDIFEATGLAPSMTNADELFNVGKQLTNAKQGRWAFDDLWPFLLFPFGVNSTWTADSGGKLIHHAVRSWRKQGGDQLRGFYEDVRDKYGTGQ